MKLVLHHITWNGPASVAENFIAQSKNLIITERDRKCPHRKRLPFNNNNNNFQYNIVVKIAICLCSFYPSMYDGWYFNSGAGSSVMVSCQHLESCSGRHVMFMPIISS